MELTTNIQSFQNDELTGFGEAVLASNLHKEWLACGGVEPAYMECIGFKKPLFLGGGDDLENLELSDLDVYWHLMGQLIVKTRHLPPGTPVRVKMA